MRIALILLLIAAPAAVAQRSHGYIFIGPGGRSFAGSTDATAHAGGGGEARIGWGFGAGGELGYVFPFERPDSGLGVASVNGYFHPVQSRIEKFDPFVTVGWSLLFRSGTANALNYGGGFNYWLDRGLGLKLEVRDHTYDAGFRRVHFWGVRFGLNIR